MFFNNKIIVEGSVNSFLYLFLICTFSFVSHFPMIFGDVNEIFLYYSAVGMMMAGIILVINNLKFLIGLFAIIPILFVNLVVIFSVEMDVKAIEEYEVWQYYLWSFIALVYSSLIYYALNSLTKKCKKRLDVKEKSIIFLIGGFLLSSIILSIINLNSVNSHNEIINLSKSEILKVNNNFKYDYSVHYKSSKEDQIVFFKENYDKIERIVNGYDLKNKKITASIIENNQVFNAKNKIFQQSLFKSYGMTFIIFSLFVYMSFLSVRTFKGKIEFEKMSKVLFLQLLLVLLFWV